MGEPLILASFLATSDHIAGRRHQLTEDDIRSLAEHVSLDDQLHMSHDERVVVPARLVHTELRRTESGSLGLWVQYVMDSDDAALLPDSLGYSVSFAKEAVPLDPNSTLPGLQIIIDSSNFSDAEFDEVVAHLQRDFNVTAGWMQQYSELPPPHVIIALLLQFVSTIPPEVLRSLIVDSVKDLLFKPASGQPTVFTLTVRSPGREVKARIETSDSDVLGEGIALLRDALELDAEFLDYEPGPKKWKRLR